MFTVFRNALVKWSDGCPYVEEASKVQVPWMTNEHSLSLRFQFFELFLRAYIYFIGNPDLKSYRFNMYQQSTTSPFDVSEVCHVCIN